MTEPAIDQTVDTPAVGDKPADSPAAPDTTADPEAAEKPEQTEEEKKAEVERKQKEADEAEELAIKKKPWFQKRIDEVTRQRHEAERRAERLEQMLQRVIDQANLTNRTVQPGQQPPAQPAQSEFIPTRPRPTREQYEFDEDRYIDAVYEWNTEQRAAKDAHSRRATEQRQAVVNFETEFNRRKADMVSAGSAKYPDFQSVIESVPADVFNIETALAITETDSPADVAYHLARNPDEAARIAKLPPLKKAVELGKISTKITQTAKPTTTAPPPPNPVGGRTPASKSESAMTMEEWVAARKAGKITGKS